MSTPVDVAPACNRELVLARILQAPRREVYRCWTDPALLKLWFAPSPFTTPDAELDVRVGGGTVITMQAPDGTRFPNRGVYLEVVEGERLVFTDAFHENWAPSADPFMVVTLTFEDHVRGTLYTARVNHWTIEGREKHEKMGFFEGWSTCTHQLEVVAARLSV